MVNLIFWTIILLLLLSFAGDEYLSYLNASYRNKKIPPELQDIYDKEKYLKSQRYAKTKYQFSFLKNSFDLLLILVMVTFGGFGYINNLIESEFENLIVVTLLFFGILIFASDLLSLPFSLYNTFVIEERFGFNTMSPKTFATDKLKSWLLLILIGGGIISLIVWIYMQYGQNFWLPTWVFISIFSVFTGMYYSTLIVPLFNKQKPLEEGELRTEIEKFADKVGFDLKNIYVIDGSKRSKKANAYFTGLGKKKRIVLFDTLIEDLETDEIVAVLAHEIGHYKKNHIHKGMLLSILQSGIMLFILSLFIESKHLSEALGASDKSFAVNLVAFGILYSPISFILGLYGNIKSRKHEYEADRFAKIYGFDDALISGLKKLSSGNLTNLTPHPSYVYFYYSHPPLYERIKALKNE